MVMTVVFEFIINYKHFYYVFSKYYVFCFVFSGEKNKMDKALDDMVNRRHSAI